MLTTDEQHIIKWLSQYGALDYRQVIRLLHGRPENYADRTIKRLKQDERIYAVNGRYLSVDPTCKPDQGVIDAVWVMLRFIDRIDPVNHYPATYPSHVFFIAEKTGYEIIVLDRDEKHLLKLLAPDEAVKYIIVLPDIGMAETLRLPKAPCLLATLNYGGEREPTIKFYTGENGHDDV